ncbi:Glu/Leu/Phe/Val family dehydrogenase [Candidatus Protochlamydia phocaeensis]|uniref:Glu/Leu/Phe/Val family dehydrogenase n=1 Tax=Candidatus Protochlamydia phocaeensis TaxID=1414722 RepID=UPI0008392149|nr:Glu/Leu/Phe/Val dehydrogenase dimerization domain-containing protein [Candidatus Protochlamydia phocaeensis]
MLKIQEIPTPGYEKVLEAQDSEIGLHCFIAIHNTAIGPAMGGMRVYPYASREDALTDALRLSKAMTYKSALAENGLGGGKSVIIANSKTDKTPALLQGFAEVVNTLKGKYIAAEDVGSTPEDMAIIRTRTPYVGALPTEKSSGDPSRFTAWGVYRGMRAVARKLWNDESLRKKIIAIQGLGHVGSKLANILFWEGAYLILCDKDPLVTQEHARLYGAQIIDTKDFISIPCDILAPCALGGIINEKTLPQLHCKAVAGAANNQLLNAEAGRELMRKGILYAPDFAINAGGIINAAAEFDPQGYDPKLARDRVNHIYDTLLEIFNKAEKEHKPANQVADELAEYKLQHLIGKRQSPLSFAK